VWHLLTVMFLPNEEETGDTKKEQHSTDDGLPLVRPSVHFRVALVEFDTVH